MSMVGKIRLSSSVRSRRTSILPVPLNSSKMTSSILLPVSVSAVARIVRLPPFSIFLAAPKNRLGRGKGFYDRFFSTLRASDQKNITAVGVCFSEQLIEYVPTGEYDVPVDGVITEQETIH